ncbi:NUDIX domain-containing protein [Notoacmeibacter ruber]|uniref:NUDIX domain-containing protein n=1 Tax=Notoacmeibacter ruber TaxID=2670375 RepID=A0A3L7JFJ6_9HYPH|nr:NUDIX domain-containing protein [Notoacmeibacter ruber]RLQ88361.1 NUDIX domain-containing protein [Notoacmeibacter ruber]
MRLSFRARHLRRAALRTFFLFKRPMTLGVRVIVHDRNADSIFLVRHTYVDGWYLPGGGVERGQTAMEAVYAELWEEARLKPQTDPRLVGVFFNRRARHDHVLLYFTDDCRRIGEHPGDREIAEAKAFPLSELPDGVTAATQRRIEEWRAGKPPATDW